MKPDNSSQTPQSACSCGDGGMCVISHFSHLVILSFLFQYSILSPSRVPKANQTKTTEEKPPEPNPLTFSRCSPSGPWSGEPSSSQRGGACPRAWPQQSRPAPAPPRRLIRTRGAAGCERAAQRRTGSSRRRSHRPGRSQLLGHWVPPRPPGASAGEGAGRLCARRGGFASGTYFAHKDWELRGGGVPARATAWPPTLL